MAVIVRTKPDVVSRLSRKESKISIVASAPSLGTSTPSPAIQANADHSDL